MKVRATLLSSVLFLACSSGGGDVGNKASEPGPPDAAAPDARVDVVTEGVDYLIVTADPLAASAERLGAYRTSTGHRVAIGRVSDILAGETTRVGAVTKIRDWVKARYDKRDAARPFFLVLLGDATEDATVDATSVPAAEHKAGGNILTDNEYADMDGDDIPDLSVGRIAAATEADADAILEKTKKFESSYQVGPWNRRLSMFASTAGFGPEIDAQIESLVFKLVEEVPYDFDINLTYAKQSSPFVFVPERFSDKVYERMNEGSLMMTYVGHGYENGFASLDWSGKEFPILDTARLDKIAITHKVPILTLIACLTGRFTAGESLSEQMLKAKDGPVAVYSSTEVSHPYANAVFIRELSQTLTTERVSTIGEVFTRAKRRSIERTNDPIRKEIDAGVSALLPADVQESLRRSHLYMYELFGDPAARIAFPKNTAAITAQATAAPGTDLAISIATGGLSSGSALVTLEGLRSTIPTGLATVPADGDPQRDAVISANYGKANDRVVAQATVTVANGTAQAKLAVPAGLASGDYWVRVYAQDGTVDAVGSAKVKVP